MRWLLSKTQDPGDASLNRPGYSSHWFQVPLWFYKDFGFTTERLGGEKKIQSSHGLGETGFKTYFGTILLNSFEEKF